jgi:preprotein translocase subunit YajC
MTTNTAHANCTHPKTKADRAKCRAQGKATVLTEVATVDAGMQALVTWNPTPQVVKIEWERELCTRCAGSGQYPSPMWQGVCLGCEGKGRKLTRVGRAALKKYEAYLAAHHTKMMIELQPGDVVRAGGGERTVVSVDPTIQRGGTIALGVEGTDTYVTWSNLTITVNYKKLTEIVGPYVKAVVLPRGEALQAALRHVAHMRGAIVHHAA